MVSLRIAKWRAIQNQTTNYYVIEIIVSSERNCFGFADGDASLFKHQNGKATSYLISLRMTLVRTYAGNLEHEIIEEPVVCRHLADDHAKLIIGIAGRCET